MTTSVFDLFSIGIGPSSSHTVGPMRAARQFLINCKTKSLFQRINRIKVELYGSLALTGKGHSIDLALLLGLEGDTPEKCDPNTIEKRIHKIRSFNTLGLLGESTITFHEGQDVIYHYDKQLPFHPNALRFIAYDSEKNELLNSLFYSTGGGFIVDHEEINTPKKQEKNVPFPFETSQELLFHCQKQNLSIAQLMFENEKTWRNSDDIRNDLLKIWHVMKEGITRGCQKDGVLPGGLNLKRRAKNLYASLVDPTRKKQPLELMEWVSVWAIAASEENAAGSRVVTAPTNGAAGVLPAVIQYYMTMTDNPSEEGVINFLLASGAIGLLYKIGASISAAEMGCMGEIGVACSMAAGGLVAALGGTNEQIENGAEIGMEHNLGLTCDPVKCLVQIPCIERNSMGAIQAINSAYLALRGDGQHNVSLDQVIAAMKQTGEDMKHHYKETSLGGLAIHVAEC